GDLPRRQVQVRLLGTGDRKQDLLEACLLTEDHEVEGLPGFKSLGDRRRLQVGDIGNGNVDADGDQSPGLNPCLMADEGLGVPVVDDPLELAVPEPARGLAGDVHQPAQIFIGIPINSAVRLDQVGAGDKNVMDATKMNSPPPADGAVKLIGEPLPITVTGGSIEPIGIDVRGQNGEIVETAVDRMARLLKYRPEQAKPIGSWFVSVQH